jgi:hypothetical protein
VNPLSGVLAEAWALYRAHARHLITIAFAIYLIASVVQALLSLLGPFGLLLAGIVSLVASFVLQATLVKAVDDVRDGTADMSMGDTVQAARPFVGKVAGASILAGIAIVVGTLLFIVPGLILLTIWCLIVPVIVLERLGVMDSFGRSRALVRGHGWQVFGTLVLVFLLLIVVGIVISAVLAPLPDAVTGFLSGLISGSLVSPYLAVVVTLGYFRLLAAHKQGSSPYGAAPPYAG